MGSTNEYNAERLDFALRSGSHRYYLGSNVFLAPCVSLGAAVCIKSNTAIGEKGFSFGFSKDLTPRPIVHKGGVLIGDYVEIGSCCTVCRATLDGANTIIGDYVKIDDHVHIAHNCHIGERTVIAAGVTLGGSVKIGKCVWVGLGSTIMNGITIGDHALIGAGANVIKDVPDDAVIAGNPAKVLRYRSWIS